ncbi:hypothetical protein GF415_04505 [Candidatus Micrarchaeota archaeon]|nr:hypothetical protein [Candidatus Micrarchaeota archaeon]
MVSKQKAPKEGKGGGRVLPRTWSQNPFLKKGPLHRMFYMGRETRRLVNEGASLKREGNLEGAFSKFQLAASGASNPAFSADLHEMAGDMMLMVSRNHFEGLKRSASLEAAAGEYKKAAAKCKDAEPERAAKLYGMAGEFFQKLGLQAQARECYCFASGLTKHQQFKNFLNARSDSL